MSNELKKLVAKRLKAAREILGLTQDEVADLLEIKRNSYTQIEIGRNSLSIEHLVKLPEILGRSVNYFLGVGTDELSGEEVEWVELYRSLPAGDARRITMEMVRGLVDRTAGHGKDSV